MRRSLALPVALSLLVASGLSAVTTLPAAASAHGPGGLLSELRSRTGGHLAVHLRDGQRLRLVGADRAHAANRPEGVGAHDAPTSAAQAWARRYGGLFGIAEANRDLRPARVVAGRSGAIVRLQQTVGGVPVAGGELVVSLDGENRLLSMGGETLPVTSFDTRPSLAADRAAAIAVRKVQRSSRLAVLHADVPELTVVDAHILGASPLLGTRLAWRSTVTAQDRSLRHSVFVDAVRGVVLLDLDENPHADRMVCDAGHNPLASQNCTSNTPPVATETNPPDARSDADTSKAFLFAGAVRDFYSSVLGRDGLDGKGGLLASTVHFCDPAVTSTCNAFRNAFWDGTEMVYGDGYASALDVVGHEMTHGVTEHTSNLFSAYQSGAINESISDVMGELIQHVEGPALGAYDPSTGWRLGEGLPGGPVRNMADPTAYGDPDHMSSPNYDSKQVFEGNFDSGGVHRNAGVGDKAAYLMTKGTGTGTFNGRAITGVSGDDDVRAVKTANIYYVTDQLLTSGADYADLAATLPEACSSLLGRALPLPDGRTAALTTADCAQVGLAVAAVEMSRQPLSPYAAIPAQAPVCPSPGTDTTIRLDTFDGATSPFASGAGYSRGHSTAKDALGGTSVGQWWWSKQAVTDYGPTATLPPYAHSGAGTLWGDDASPADLSNAADREDAWIQTTSAIPAHVGTYVRFAHAWEFEYGPLSSGGPVDKFDGGRVEFSVDTGSHWYDAGATSPVSSKALLVNGLYNGNISDTGASAGYPDPNPLKGARAFVGSSHGWTSSRLDLSPLAGKPVLLRWRIGADDVGSSLGWYIDDVRSYSCNPTALTVSLPTATTYGTAASLNAHLSRAGSTTGLVGYPVQLYSRKHGTTAWSVTTATTNSSGNVVWSVKPSYTWDYQVRFGGRAPLAPTASSIRVLGVRTRISRTLSATALTLGHTFVVSGVVSPNHAGQRVYLQRYYSGAWHTLSYQPLASTSGYRFTYKPTVRGTLSFRMDKPVDSDHYENSSTFTVKIY